MLLQSSQLIAPITARIRAVITALVTRSWQQRSSTYSEASLEEFMHVDRAAVAALLQPVQTAQTRAGRAVVAVASRRHARLVALARQAVL